LAATGTNRTGTRGGGARRLET